MNISLMKNSMVKIKWLLVIPVLLVFVATGCNHYDELNKSKSDSSPNEESHNSGEDCNSCHHDNNNEASQKWWYAAGTVYEVNGVKEASSGEVQLWSGPGATGELFHTMKIDKKGNFYTQRIINFKAGYFPIVIHNSDTFVMSEIVTGTDLNKSCNNCHGNNGNGLHTPKITLN